MSIMRCGVSLHKVLLDKFDRLIARQGYANRSEAIRDLIRDRLVAEEWEAGNQETVGTVTLVYSHDTRELTENLNEMQHHHHSAIISTVHVHLDEHTCLEVRSLRGKGDEIKAIADKLIGTKGVKHGKLTVTTTGKGIV
jgi:CopG family transcriptional regulator, nickel-responsive regulator